MYFGICVDLKKKMHKNIQYTIIQTNTFQTHSLQIMVLKNHILETLQNVFEFVTLQ